MNKTLNKNLTLLFILITIGSKSFAAQSQPVTKNVPASTTNAQITSPQQEVDYSNCNKIFIVDSQKLFYITLAAINANRFTIDEIQSKSGYIIFSVWQRQFLANIINIDAQHSMLKITPCNNNYVFPIGIVQNMFKYVELNLNTPIEKIPTT